MSYYLPSAARDLKKNVENVRIDEIHRVINESSFSSRDAGYADNKVKGTEVKLYFSTTGLNVEELSLLRDSAPNMNYTSGKLSCSWKLSKRFAFENESNLHQIMMSRMSKEVQDVYTTRTEMVGSGHSGLTKEEGRAVTPAPGFWARLAASVRPEKTVRDTEFSMG